MLSICDIFIDNALFLHISVPLPLIFQLDLQSFRGQNRFVDDAKWLFHKNWVAVGQLSKVTGKTFK